MNPPVNIPVTPYLSPLGPPDSNPTWPSQVSKGTGPLWVC